MELIFCDLPQCSGPTGRFLLHSLASVAQLEGELISQRVREALAQAKARGVKLGAQPGKSPLQKWIRENGTGKACRGNREGAIRRAEPWRPIIEELLDAGMGNCQIARTLNERGETGVRGGKWNATAIRVLRQRLDATVV